MTAAETMALHTYKVTLPAGWLADGKKRNDPSRHIATVVAAGVTYSEHGALVFYNGAGDIVKAYAAGMWLTLQRDPTPEDNIGVAA